MVRPQRAQSRRTDWPLWIAASRNPVDRQRGHSPGRMATPPGGSPLAARSPRASPANSSARWNLAPSQSRRCRPPSKSSHHSSPPHFGQGSPGGTESAGQPSAPRGSGLGSHDVIAGAFGTRGGSAASGPGSCPRGPRTAARSPSNGPARKSVASKPISSPIPTPGNVHQVHHVHQTSQSPAEKALGNKAKTAFWCTWWACCTCAGVYPSDSPSPSGRPRAMP
jgi:hypothetical protein